MKNKFIRFAVLVSLSTLIFQKPVYSVPTIWEDARISLSELLNSGWQMIEYSTDRVAANSNAGNGFDARRYSFVLIKNNKYIVCIIENPSPPTANAASCRKLN